MTNYKIILNRINFCENEGIAITNYGIVLAFLNGILDRSQNKSLCTEWTVT